MKKIILLFCVWMVNHVNAQVKTPVQWEFSSKKISNITYEVHITGTIQFGWHTYSQTTPKGGPVPSEIKFTNNPLVTLTGKTKEVGKLEEHFEKLFNVDVKQYSNNIDFVQTVTLKKPVKTNISGSLEYMVCNDQECLPPTTITFSVKIL